MKVSIRKSRSPLVLKSAASFMSKSSPWTNLGIDYKACLKTLKSPSFDFYAAFVKKELAGFIFRLFKVFFISSICKKCETPVEVRLHAPE